MEKGLKGREERRGADRERREKRMSQQQVSRLPEMGGAAIRARGIFLP